jgi:Ca2+-binding RTX toxin-like protein
MRSTLVLMAATALILLVAGGVALAATIDCPNASAGYCYGTKAGDALYGTDDDRMYGYGTADLMFGDGGEDFMRGGTEARLGDRMRGGGGPDRMNGQGGNDVIRGGPGSDILKTGRGLDRVNAKDGKKDFITCKGKNDIIDYDRGLDVLQGCSIRRSS